MGAKGNAWWSGLLPVQRKTVIALGLLMALLVLIDGLIDERWASVLVGVLLALAGVVVGGKGVRFITPIGIGFAAFRLYDGAQLFTNFYATAASVIPIFLLAATVEFRPLLRDSARTWVELACFATTMVYMLFAEAAALYAVGVCAPDQQCVHDTLRFLGTTTDGGLSGIVVGGLAGGLATMTVVALLPPQMPDDEAPTASATGA
jgi:hypothetical protein